MDEFALQNFQNRVAQPLAVLLGYLLELLLRQLKRFQRGLHGRQSRVGET
jgi:hypothetical protein